MELLKIQKAYEKLMREIELVLPGNSPARYEYYKLFPQLCISTEYFYSTKFDICTYVFDTFDNQNQVDAHYW